MVEKYNLIDDLGKKNEELVGPKKLSLMGIGDFPGKSALMRTAMNVKHHNQHLTIDDPEFPIVFNGNENLMGEESSYYCKTDKNYKVIDIVKKYEGLLKGRVYEALYFLYCEDDHSYTVIERKECEDLSEKYGFDYRNDYIDNLEVGERIPENTVLYTPTAYDENMNVGIGVNALMLNAVSPYVNEDAILISESLSKRMVSNDVTSLPIPVNDNTIFINKYGDKSHYWGLPNIGDYITDGIVCATRNIQENRMFSNLRDNALSRINYSSDTIYYGSGQIIDINIYCNNPKLKQNVINEQLIRYINDQKEYYRKIYKVCRKITSDPDAVIDNDVYYWKRKAINYFDEEVKWAYNDNVFSNLMVEVMIRKKEPIKIGRKITGRFGNKTVVSKIIPDAEMPYIVLDDYVDEYGVHHPSGEKRHVDAITNPIAFLNRTIPMVLNENTLTFMQDKLRIHLRTLASRDVQMNLVIKFMNIINPKEAAIMRKRYDGLSPYEQREYMKSIIDTGIFMKVESFSDDIIIRDAIIQVYEEFDKIMAPYKLYVPKPRWGRDIYVGELHIGSQYLLKLKQSGEKGFSGRSAGAISEENLPEKSNEDKIGKSWHSNTAIRFGELTWAHVKIRLIAGTGSLGYNYQATMVTCVVAKGNSGDMVKRL